MADVLFVCSGNTCRSPMAATIFNDLCERRGLPWRAESAGLYPQDGNAASDGAFFAMKERGLSLSRHVAQPLSRQLVQEVQLIVTMGESYAEVVRSRYPQAKIVAFDPPIHDPYGSSPGVYRATAEELTERMEWVLSLLPDAFANAMQEV